MRSEQIYMAPDGTLTGIQKWLEQQNFSGSLVSQTLDIQARGISIGWTNVLPQVPYPDGMQIVQVSNQPPHKNTDKVVAFFLLKKKHTTLLSVNK